MRDTSDFHAARILVVDDEEINLRLFKRILESDGYTNIVTTTDGSMVVTIADEFQPDLLLLDLKMPAPDGFAILRALGDRITGSNRLPVLILTGDATPEAKRTTLSLGARDFLAKPFDSIEALLRIRNLLVTRFLQKELEGNNSMLETRVAERTRELRESEIEILERLARTCEVRDDATGQHTQRVGAMSESIAEAMGLPMSEVELIARAAPMHDIGKTAIADAILLKPGKLTEIEMGIMRQHTVIGARILSGGRSSLMIAAERIALSHHERWDGTGYPNGLKGEAIPLEARIVALADSFDALSHNRPYRSAIPLPEILAEMERSAGSHFDPAVVAAMFESGGNWRSKVSSPRPVKALYLPDEDFPARAVLDAS